MKYINIETSKGRERYVKAVKELGEYIAQNAEKIVPDPLDSVTDINIYASIGTKHMCKMSVTINRYCEVTSELE